MKKTKKIFLSFVLIIFACPAFAAQKIDLNLTKLNSMMTYSSVMNILMDPDKYLGKTIKIQGLFDSAQDPDTGTDYFAVAIMDAAACCAMGLDFSPKKEYNYKFPEDFPEIGAKITVVGRLEKYSEGDDIYYQLAEADMFK